MSSGFSITANCHCYLALLIAGEDYPPFVDGLQDYVHLTLPLVEKKLIAFA